MNPLSGITGVILAGGQSSRFGSNKALALLNGKPLIQHVSDTVTSVFDDCLLVTNTPGEYDFLKMETIRDQYRDMGPLAGIHAALSHSGNHWIFVVCCDMPLVTTELIKFLCGFAYGEHEAVIPWLAKGAEPLCGLYRKTALETIELQLENNRVQLRELLGNLSVNRVLEEELQAVPNVLQCFVNVNREQDLKKLEPGTTDKPEKS